MNENKGFAVVNNFISEHWSNTILKDIERSQISTEVSGVRNINKKLNSVSEYLDSEEFNKSSAPFIPRHSQLVRAILFNKSPVSNWFVSWHQDKTVAVSSKFEASGWNTWSVKDDILHVQPPLAVLESIVTIRIHLDTTRKENGCLKIIPGSHKFGLLTQNHIREIVTGELPYFCECDKYAALIMRPHILHASSKSLKPENRRVLHFEFSNWQLPKGINWG